MTDFISEVKDALETYEPNPIGSRCRFAVLLPLLYHEGEWQILYEVRAQKISQPGEIAFPGGALEVDECPSDAAIRETMEELGVAREQIELLGEFDFFANDSAIIYCFIGLLKNISPDALCANLCEVQEVFTLSLAWLCCHPPTYYLTVNKPDLSDDFPICRLPGGKNYDWNRRQQKVGFYDITENGYNLWGLTARFTDRFIDFIKESGVYDCIPCLKGELDESP